MVYCVALVYVDMPCCVMVARDNSAWHGVVTWCVMRVVLMVRCVTMYGDMV